VSSLDELLTQFDQNKDDIKDIYSAIGLTRSEILAAKPTVIQAKDTLYLMTRYGKMSNETHEVSISYAKSSGGTDKATTTILCTSSPTSNNTDNTSGSTSSNTCYPTDAQNC
jgi:hypothetical protein